MFSTREMIEVWFKIARPSTTFYLVVLGEPGGTRGNEPHGGVDRQVEAIGTSGSWSSSRLVSASAS